MRAVLIGLGPIGIEVGRALIARGIPVAGAADPAATLVGGDLALLIPGSPAGLAVAADATDACRHGRAGDVAVICTGSRLAAVTSAIDAALEAGLHVVSTCEELAHPALRNPQLAARLDDHARHRGVAILGAGVNPGLVMDRLALAAAWGCARVDHIRVDRIVDAAQRRGPLRAKVGAGLTPESFRAGVADGSLGHVGLGESAALLAEGVGIPVGALEETIDAVTDAKSGLVRGLHQVACVLSGGVERIRLELTMAIDAADPHDRIVIAGDPPVDLVVRGGFHGDRATVGAAVSAVLAVARLAPGLYRATGTSYGRSATPG